ncbi:reverse transcriptase [Phytophthora megakarya]|uniref:Reverse transcriptase n=1 Tax=Phytophthora megakarya TaxID=4795 RepID=A0A225VSQ1_9STRA|nr:reverse transcriptase [Phytophthora megakarya]
MCSQSDHSGSVNGLCDPSAKISSRVQCPVVMAVLVYWYASIDDLVFGAPSLIRHDRDPRFMSEVFQAFAELIQARSRSTRSYRSQANGQQQQERSARTVMQSVKGYVEEPLQQDWDEIA